MPMVRGTCDDSLLHAYGEGTCDNVELHVEKFSFSRRGSNDTEVEALRSQLQGWLWICVSSGKGKEEALSGKSSLLVIVNL